MDRLLRGFALVDLDAAQATTGLTTHGNDSDDDEDQDTEILVAERIPLKTWNRFAQLNNLPRGLRLRQLVWDDGRVSITELPISIGHEAAIDSVRRAFWDAVGGYGLNRGQANLAGPAPNGGQVTYSPDYAFLPLRTIPGVQIPGTQVPRGRATVVVEIMRSQRWASARPKMQMYRGLEDVQYIFCLKMSLAMKRWSYEFYDVPNRSPPPGQDARQHSFSISERSVPANHLHLVHFDSRRVLGLPQQAQLPAAIPDQVVIDLVAVAQHARAAAREMGERVAG